MASLVYTYRGLQRIPFDGFNFLGMSALYADGTYTILLHEQNTGRLSSHLTSTLRSTDLSSWTSSNGTIDGFASGASYVSGAAPGLGAINAPQSIVKFKGKFYGAANGNLNRYSLATSIDGVTWTTHPQITVGANKYTFVSTLNQIGEERCVWPTCVDSVTAAISGSNLILRLSNGFSNASPLEAILVSSDGISWRESTMPVLCRTFDLAVTDTAVILYDGVSTTICKADASITTWNAYTPNVSSGGRLIPMGRTLKPTQIYRVGAEFWARAGVGIENYYLFSSDGLNWFARDGVPLNCPSSFTHDTNVGRVGTKFVSLTPVCHIVGTTETRTLATSFDGVNWTFRAIPTITKNGQILPVISGLDSYGGPYAGSQTRDAYVVIPNTESILIWGTLRNTTTADESGVLKVNYNF